MSALTWQRAGSVFLTVLALSVGVVWAQGRSDGTDASGSLAALTTEVRQLRIAVQELARSQTQSQALGVYLSVQQNRLTQAAAQLDAARKDVEGSTLRLGELSSKAGELELALQRTVAPQEREAIEQMTGVTKREQSSAARQAQQAQTRYDELSQSVQLEESRWSDLVSRLEQLLKR
jgi:chromosome segregation ATPase